MSGKLCGHCGAENDATRVYCTNCGTRLPDEVVEVAAAEAVADEKAPVSASPFAGADAGLSAPPLPQAAPRPANRTRVKPAKSFRPVKPVAQVGVAGVLFRQILLTAVLGAVLAVVIQMARTPDEVPEPSEVNPAGAAMTMETLMGGAQSSRAGSWTLNQSAANEFLISTLRMDASGAPSSLRAEFLRAFMVFREGNGDFCIEQGFLGLRIYFCLRFEPITVGGKLDVRITGASIGRMPVSPVLAPLMLPVFNPSLNGLAKVRENLQKATGAKISPSDAVIEWPGNGAAAQ